MTTFPRGDVVGKDPRRLRRLISAMQWAGILSENEAVSAIIAYRQNDRVHGGSEAVVHYGGAEALIRRSIELRGYARDIDRRVREATNGCDRTT